MVIFGASGDLTKRKLIPALYNLARENLLSRQFAVVGSARRPMTNESFRQKLTEEMKEFATGPVDPDLWDWFVRRLYYLPGDGQDPETYKRLKELLTQIDKEHGTPGNYFYYLATAPGLFAGLINQLGLAGLTHEANGRWRRVIIEKPFGHDFSSMKSKSIASITTWAKKPSRTSWSSALPTAFSSPSGTGAISTTCRSPWPKPSAWRSAVPITMKLAPCVTWCRITSSN
jgi:glucose-6-phosphate 1-dehydrogenase